MSAIRPSFYTDLYLPDLPFIDSSDARYKDIFFLYEAVRKLAQQIDTVLTLSEDVRIDSATHGLILKDTQATPHYWRVTVNNVGVLVVTDIGTSLP